MNKEKCELLYNRLLEIIKEFREQGVDISYITLEHNKGTMEIGKSSLILERNYINKK